MYLGSRSSDRFGRLYEKFHESGEDCYKDCWRYEIELKAEQATAAVKHIAAASDPALSITSTVHAFFVERGVKPPFGPTDQGPFRRVHVEPGDDLERHEWLEDAIVPVIEGLRARGMVPEMRQLFGFTQHERAE